MSDAATIVNEMMIMTGLWIKSRYVSDPIHLGATPEAYPSLQAEHWVILEKYMRKYNEESTRVDGIRVGVDPDNVYFRSHSLFGGL